MESIVVIVEHERVYASDRRCPFCKMIFATKAEMRAHRDATHKEKPFACTFRGCNFRSRWKCGLHNHMFTHSKKVLKCMVTDCDYSTTVPVQMKRHVESQHSGKVAYPCDTHRRL